MKVKDAMTRRVAQIAPQATLAAAAELMRAEETGLLAVVDEGGIAKGVLTERDIVLKAVLAGREISATLVQDAMSTGIIFVVEDAQVGEAIGMLARHGSSRLLVTDENGFLTGVIVNDESSAASPPEIIAGRLSEACCAKNRNAVPKSETALANISRRLGISPAR